MKYSSHSTYYNKDGIEVPSVTTILKILNKPALTIWANNLGWNRKSVKKVLEEVSDIGTCVHELINCILSKKKLEYSKPHIPFSVLLPYLNNFMKFYKQHEFEPIILEGSLSLDKFGGTIDYYGKLNGKYTIIDFKTSKKVRLTMFLQLAAYCVMLEEHGHTVEQVGILIVNDKQNGFRCISREELNPYIEVFNALVTLFHLYYALNEDENWHETII